MFFLCSVLGMSGFEPHRAALLRLAEMTSSVLEDAFARVKASDGPGFFAATSVFADLGRGLRLTIALDLRLAQFNPAATQPTTVRAQASDDETHAEREDFAEHPVALERERERETERDGFAMDPLGRFCALETLITRTPALDPDHKVSAQIIELKAFLSDCELPPTTPPTTPFGPPAAGHAAAATLSRPRTAPSAAACDAAPAETRPRRIVAGSLTTQDR